MLRIGIDIDGVLGGQVEAALPVLNQYLGTNYSLDQWDYWFFGQDMLGDKKTLLDMLDAVWMQGLVMPQEPGIAAKVKKLSRLGPISIITKRTHKSHPHVVQRLQDWGVKYSNMIFVGDGQKLDYPIDILIDDHPDYDDHFHNYPEKLLLVRAQPWNQHDVSLVTNVYYVQDLTDAWLRIKLLQQQGVI